MTTPHVPHSSSTGNFSAVPKPDEKSDNFEKRSILGTLPSIEAEVSEHHEDRYNGPERSGIEAHISAYGLLTAVYHRERRHCTGARVSEYTREVAHVGDLCQTIGARRCSFSIGQISLEGSFMSPPVDIGLVRARQGAVRELLEGGAARREIDSIIERSDDDLSTVLRFVDPSWGERTRAQEFSDTREALQRLGKLGDSTLNFKSELLNSTVATLKLFSKNNSLRYFSEGICEVGRGVALCADAPLLNRVFYRYIPGPVGPKTLAVCSLGGLATTAGVAMQVPEIAVLGPAGIMPLIPSLSHKESYDDRRFFFPVSRLLWSDQQFGRALTALALLDELRALACIADEFQGGAVLPEIMECKRHVLHVRDAHNPLLALGEGLSVANDFIFDSGVTKGLTGPNSGGKSTFGRTAIQLQVLGQIGAPLPAKYARLSLADEVLYQGQTVDKLFDPEGRFGEELRVTKGLFERATPMTLAVFDELAQGTTHQESRDVASYIIRGFKKLGINAILITHDHELVEHLSGEAVVEPVQVEYRDEIATYRVVPGISRSSHAERVAKKVGLGKDDVERLVAARLMEQQT